MKEKNPLIKKIKEDDTLIKKIKELNELNRGSLSITHYTLGWEVSSYKDNTPLNKEHVVGEDFELMIDKALKIGKKKEEMLEKME